ncbi:MAG: Hsp20/alpha crystallin family protein [Phycisphaerales bacterium]|nr:Hsp20/alpha crystallin family protein [Phycisphaerales bacterium]|tara:strand:- start:20202 stop:20633 length:432 start_codon:yes stop_codon:yes gene_type:complete
MTTFTTSPVLANEHTNHICDNPRCELTSDNRVDHLSIVKAAGWLIIDMEIHDVVARDLDVTVDGQLVTIKSLPRIDAPSSPVRITRDYMRSSSERVIELPDPVDMERRDLIKATLLDGVLRLVLPTMKARQERTMLHLNDAIS